MRVLRGRMSEPQEAAGTSGEPEPGGVEDGFREVIGPLAAGAGSEAWLPGQSASTTQPRRLETDGTTSGQPGRMASDGAKPGPMAAKGP